MIREISAKAYAKVNFGLRVLPKREDGFHDIESIFQTIDIYDELIVTPTDSKGCIVQCDSMQLPENNTLRKAFDAFCQTTGLNFGIHVKLIKGIPSGGGLGGGSSDAATLVKLLEKLCEIKLSSSQKEYIASVTGSDVFFFMNCDDEGKGCALVSGRGEKVRLITARKDLYLVLVFPNVSSSTKEAYELVDEYYKSENKISGPAFYELEEIYNQSIEKWTFINTFTPVISEKYQEIDTAIKELETYGCCYAQMSGSGSTVFGMFEHKHLAEAVGKMLSNNRKFKIVKAL